MTVSDLRYKKGDWIVHTRYGVGQISGKDKKTVGDEKKKYFVVETFNGTYWLPFENITEDYIRPVAAESTFQNMLTKIRKKPKKLAKNFRERRKDISEIVTDGALVGVARLLRDLNGRWKRKKINASEKESFEQLKERFIHEWTIAAGIDAEEASQRLNAALNVSADKIVI